MPKYRLTGNRKGHGEFQAPVVAESEDDVIETFIESLDEDVNEKDFHNFTVERWR